jgi:MYXO-CTERM domain-containing protein
VVSSPASPAGLMMIGGLVLGLLWALRRIRLEED